MSPSMGDGARYGLGDYFLSWWRVTEGVVRLAAGFLPWAAELGAAKAALLPGGVAPSGLTTPFPEQLRKACSGREV